MQQVKVEMHLGQDQPLDTAEELITDQSQRTTLDETEVFQHRHKSMGIMLVLNPHAKF